MLKQYTRAQYDAKFLSVLGLKAQLKKETRELDEIAEVVFGGSKGASATQGHSAADAEPVTPIVPPVPVIPTAPGKGVLFATLEGVGETTVPTLKLMQDQGGTMTAEKLAERAGLKAGAAYQRLKRLLEADFITKTPQRGVYRITQKGMALVAA